jgi:hypothetical protein
MPNRTAKTVSAIFAAVLASSYLATAPGHATDAADSCLSAPKGAAPEGSHWYYRIDRPTNRHCWYVKDAKVASQGAPQDLSPAANNVSPPKKPAPPPVVANARAELPLPQPRADQDMRVAQQIPADAATIAPRANAPDANTQQPVAASPWPDPAAVAPPVNATPPAPAPIAASPNQRSQPLAAPPPPLVRTIAARSAVDFPTEKNAISIPKLLLVLAGALSVVSVMGGSIFGFGSRRPARRNVRPNWHTNLDSAGINRRPPPVYPNAGRRTRDARASDDPNRRIAEMLARLSRNVPT